MIRFVGFDKEKLEKYRGSENAFYFDVRMKAFEKLADAQEPDFRHGLNIDVAPQNTEITLKNIFSPEYSVSEPEVVTIAKELPDGWNEFFTDSWKTSLDCTKWGLIHEAFANSFMLVDIADNAVFEKPIVISENVIDGPLFNTVLVRVGKNCSVKILYQRSDAEGVRFICDEVKILAKENSSVDFLSVQDFSDSSFHFSRRRSIVQRNATVHVSDVVVGSSYTKLDVVNFLSDSGAEGTSKVLFSGTDRHLLDINTESIHRAKETNSDIVTKGVLSGRARALSRGLVKISSDSEGSNGYETQDVLLLSEDAEAYAVPNLEIDNHEVKCSHGSSVGQLDANAIFYLMSRGFSRNDAIKHIVQGYFAPVLDQFGEEFKETISEKLFGSLQFSGPLTRESAIAALKKVQDPEIPLDLWTLGLIYDLKIQEDDSIDVTMTFTSPMCPFGAKMMNDVRAALIVAGFSDARVEVVLEPVWKPSEEVKMLLGLA